MKFNLKYLSRLPNLKDLLNKRAKHVAEFVPPGHFYSPIPNLNEVQKYRSRLFDDKKVEIGEIDLQQSDQIQLLYQFEPLYKDLPFTEQKKTPYRYYYENPAFSYGDAIMLYSLLRLIKPRRYIEVGSGYSSCVALDTDELFLDQKTAFTFIEPYPKLLYSLLNKNDLKRITVIPNNLQDISVEHFSELSENDFVFFDSTHVCKAGSDVQYIFSDILPILPKGVYIHFHDIFYPFEYPEEWLLEGRAWNELYILRAFLQNNTKYKIIYFNNYMGKVNKALLHSKLPLVTKNVGGSIWLRKY